jgi:hypothetical protein
MSVFKTRGRPMHVEALMYTGINVPALRNLASASGSTSGLISLALPVLRPADVESKLALSADHSSRLLRTKYCG